MIFRKQATPAKDKSAAETGTVRALLSKQLEWAGESVLLFFLV